MPPLPREAARESRAARICMSRRLSSSAARRPLPLDEAHGAPNCGSASDPFPFPLRLSLPHSPSRGRSGVTNARGESFAPPGRLRPLEQAAYAVIVKPDAQECRSPQPLCRARPRFVGEDTRDQGSSATHDVPFFAPLQRVEAATIASDRARDGVPVCSAASARGPTPAHPRAVAPLRGKIFAGSCRNTPQGSVLPDRALKSRKRIQDACTSPPLSSPVVYKRVIRLT